MLFKKSHTFAEVAAQVLRLKQLKSPNTRLAANFQISRLTRNFGRRSISRISEDDWVEYVAAQRSVRDRKFFDDRKYMKMILLYAHRRRYIQSVPPLPIPDLPSTAGRALSASEIRELERYANPALRLQIRIAWKMGLRLREMLRLRWDQFDWVKNTIRFGAAETKTRRARVVPIPIDLIPEFLEIMRCSQSRFVFPGRYGIGNAESNKTAWRRCKRDAQIRARWHDLRHTCATTLIQRGVRIDIVCLYLGMSEAVLNRTYLHPSDEEMRRAAEVMSA